MTQDQKFRALLEYAGHKEACCKARDEHLSGPNVLQPIPCLCGLNMLLDTPAAAPDESDLRAQLARVVSALRSLIRGIKEADADEDWPEYDAGVEALAALEDDGTLAALQRVRQYALEIHNAGCECSVKEALDATAWLDGGKETR